MKEKMRRELREAQGWITVADAAKVIGGSVQTVYARIKAGELSTVPPFKNPILLHLDEVRHMAEMPPKPRGIRNVPDSITARVREALRQRFPCGEVPFGAMSELAREFGCSRELVRVQANRMDMARARRTPVRMCASCGVELGRTTRVREFCLACLRVDLPCASCGKLVSVSAARFARKLNKDPRYTGRVFCDRRCFGTYAGKHYGWGKNKIEEILGEGLTTPRGTPII